MILKLTSLALTFKFIYSLRAFHASGTVTGTWVDTDSKQETQIHKLYCYIIIISSYQNDANQFTHSLDFHISLPCLSGLQPITTPEMRQEWSRQQRHAGEVCPARRPVPWSRVQGRQGGRKVRKVRSLTTCYGSERNEAGQGAVRENDDPDFPHRCVWKLRTDAGGKKELVRKMLEQSDMRWWYSEPWSWKGSDKKGSLSEYILNLTDKMWDVREGAVQVDSKVDGSHTRRAESSPTRIKKLTVEHLGEGARSREKSLCFHKLNWRHLLDPEVKRQHHRWRSQCPVRELDLGEETNLTCWPTNANVSRH